MRPLVLVATALFGAVLLAGCGSKETETYTGPKTEGANAELPATAPDDMQKNIAKPPADYKVPGSGQ